MLWPRLRNYIPNLGAYSATFVGAPIGTKTRLTYERSTRTKLPAHAARALARYFAPWQYLFLSPLSVGARWRPLPCS
jgi:hypothetical protein